MNPGKPNGQEVKEAAPPPLPRWDDGPQHERSYWWVWLIVIAVVAGGGFVFRSPLIAAFHSVFSKNAAPDAAGGRGKAPPVVIALVAKGDMDIFLNGLGTVTPLRTVLIRARVDGQIDTIAFTEGQLVKKGDLLVQIDPRPFQVQLEQAEGQLAKDQAALDDAKIDLGRYKELNASKSISKQVLDTQQALVHQDEAAIKVDQASIDTAKLQLTYARVTSPIDGRIGLRMADEGNIVHASDSNGLAVVSQVQPITVVFSLPEDNIPQVLKKMATGEPVRVDAFDRDLKTKLATGTLLAIDNQIDPGSGTLRFKASFKNEDGGLFPNQFVNARLLVDTLRDAVIVPTAAVQRSPTSTFVYVVSTDKTVRLQDVVVAATDADRTALSDKTELKVGEMVVTDGVDKLVPGREVSIGRGGGATRPSTRPAGAGGGGAPHAGHHEEASPGVHPQSATQGAGRSATNQVSE